MTPEEQLIQWVKGNSVHNGKTKTDGECCPDFSCCGSQIVNRDVREAFLIAHLRGDEKTTSSMCLAFLSGILASKVLRDKVFLCGGKHESKRH